MYVVVLGSNVPLVVSFKERDVYCALLLRQVGNHASQRQPTGSQNPAPHHTLSTVMMGTIDFNFILFIYGNVRLFLSLGYFFI